jgi:hypothetical protein
LNDAITCRRKRTPEKSTADRKRATINTKKEINEVLPNLHCGKFPKLPLCPAML